MKKMKMGIVFGLCALTLTSLASCGDITAKDDLVLTYKFTTSSGDVKEAEINAQDVYERYLVNEGYIERTKRGRILTLKGIKKCEEVLLNDDF